MGQERGGRQEKTTKQKKRNEKLNKTSHISKSFVPSPPSLVPSGRAGRETAGGAWTPWGLQHDAVLTADGSLNRHDVFDEGLVVDAAVLVLLALHESVDLGLGHLLAQC